MDTILLLTPTEPDGSLPRAALEALSAARDAGGAVTVGLFGAKTGPAAAQLAGAGVAGVLTAEAEALGEPRYGTDAAAATALARASGATVVDRPRALARGPHRRGGGAAAGWPHRHPRDAGLCRRRRPLHLALVLPAAHRGQALARGAALGAAGRPGRVPGGRGRGRGCAIGEAGPGRARPRAAALEGHRPPLAHLGRADHPPRRQGPVRGRRRVDQEAGRRPAPSRSRRGADRGLPPRLGGLAGHLQVAHRSGRRGAEGARVHDPPEPGRPDRLDPAPPHAACPPAATARSRTWWAGASSGSGGP